MPRSRRAPMVVPARRARRHPDAELGRDADATSGDAGPRGPRRFGWRHLVAALVLGAAVGAVVALGVRIAGGAAGDDPATRLEAVASDYLEVVATGDADRATEMAPLGAGAEVAGAGILAAAMPLEPVGVGPARVDGDRGSVDVRYRVGDAELQRTLRASLTPAGWLLATSLAEATDTGGNEPAAVLRVAGIDLPERTDLHLYPGVYRLDVIEGPVFAWGGDVFTIDGDPSTRTTVRADRSLMPAFAQQLQGLGLDVIAACRARADCPIRTGFGFEPAAEVLVLQTLDDGRTIDLNVPLVARDPSGNEWRDVIVRLTLDSRGLPIDWRCSSLAGGSALASPGGTLSPCP